MTLVTCHKVYLEFLSESFLLFRVFKIEKWKHTVNITMKARYLKTLYLKSVQSFSRNSEKFAKLSASVMKYIFDKIVDMQYLCQN